jgi:integrase
MYIKKHIVPELGQLKLKEILPIHLQEFYNKKAKTSKWKTVAKYHSFLHRAFEDARINKFIKTNPCDGIKLPDKAREKYKPCIFRESDLDKLLVAVAGTVDEVCIVIASAIGFRRGELFGLKWSNIDYKNQTVTVEETFTRFNKNIIKDPKTESSKRTIKAPEYVFNLLKKWQNTKACSMSDRIISEYKPQSYSSHFSNLLKKHGLPHVRFHDLRHYNAILMLRYGVPDKVAAYRLGHSQVSTTREIYQHVLQEMDDKASEIITNNSSHLKN